MIDFSLHPAVTDPFTVAKHQHNIMSFHDIDRLPEPPWTSLYLPNNRFITLTSGKFVTLSIRGSCDNFVGLIIRLNAESRTVRIRLFLSWTQLLERFPALAMHDLSFWPQQFSRKSPMYLCDTDVVEETNVSEIKEYAFVFYNDDVALRQVSGMSNMYTVTTCVYSQSMKFKHHRSFHSFPSASYFGNERLISCVPSMILNQMLLIKNRLQHALNTRSKSSKQVATIHIDNVSPFTWSWITDNAAESINVEYSYAVSKNTFIEKDALVAMKWRVVQESLFLHLPDHLQSAQRILGISAGLGVRTFVSCRFSNRRRLEVAEGNHQIDRADIINVVPFEQHHQNEFVERGILFKYIPPSCALSIVIRFRKVHGEASIQHFLTARGINISEEDDGGNSWPLHSETND